jgi:hypothetical protein
MASFSFFKFFKIIFSTAPGSVKRNSNQTDILNSDGKTNENVELDINNGEAEAEDFMWPFIDEIEVFNINLDKYFVDTEIISPCETDKISTNGLTSFPFPSSTLGSAQLLSPLDFTPSASPLSSTPEPSRAKFSSSEIIILPLNSQKLSDSSPNGILDRRLNRRSANSLILNDSLNSTDLFTPPKKIRRDLPDLNDNHKKVPCLMNVLLNGYKYDEDPSFNKNLKKPTILPITSSIPKNNNDDEDQSQKINTLHLKLVDTFPRGPHQ